MTATAELTAKIEKIQRASEAAWDTCVDTASDTDAADEARDEGIECYETAIDAIDHGDFAAAKSALESAETLEREWGDDSFARQALELVESYHAAGCSQEWLVPDRPFQPGTTVPGCGGTMSPESDNKWQPRQPRP